MKHNSIWLLIIVAGSTIIGCATVFAFLYSSLKTNCDAIIEQKNATIEFLKEKATPNLSQWDFGSEKLNHKCQKTIFFKENFKYPPAIVTTQGNDVGDPIAMIVTNITTKSFSLKVLGIPGRAFAHGKEVTVNWIAISKK